MDLYKVPCTIFTEYLSLYFKQSGVAIILIIEVTLFFVLSVLKYNNLVFNKRVREVRFPRC